MSPDFKDPVPDEYQFQEQIKKALVTHSSTALFNWLVSEDNKNSEEHVLSVKIFLIFE